MKRRLLQDLILSALFIALAIVLPFITAQIPAIGQLLTPMHFPIIIGAFILGPKYGTVIGFISPLLRMFLFTMPPFPISMLMAFELATYGLLVGLLYQYLKNFKLKPIFQILISLVIAMVSGRIIYALAGIIFMSGAHFWSLFVTTFTLSSVGIALQLILIPMLMLRLRHYIFINR